MFRIPCNMCGGVSEFLAEWMRVVRIPVGMGERCQNSFESRCVVSEFFVERMSGQNSLQNG